MAVSAVLPKPPATQAAEAAPAVVPPDCPRGEYLAVAKSAISVQEVPSQCSVTAVPKPGDGVYPPNAMHSV